MSTDLAGSTWRPNTIYSFDVPAQEHIFIAFKDDGKAVGYGSCNRFFGGYTVDGNGISIGPIASTKMGCPGKYELETSFLSVLQAAKTFKHDGPSLLLFDDEGQEIAALVKSDDA